MDGWWMEQFDKVDAEGIDFVPFGFNPCYSNQSEVYCSYTKEEFFKKGFYPKSPYLFWKMVDGLKVYLEIKK